MRIISISNQKGGVGKTTLSINIAAGLIKEGKRVLLIDCDPQCNSTDTYGAVVEDEYTLYDVLIDKASIKNAIQKTSFGDIVACDDLLKNPDTKITEQGKEYKLKESLEPVKSDYDFIIIDTPPQRDVLLSNALTASTDVIIPITPDRYSLQGLAQLYENIKLCKKYSNPDLRIAGIVLNRYAQREVLTKNTLRDIPHFLEIMNTRMFSSYIRESAAARQAQAMKENLLAYDPQSTTATDVMALVNEILEESNGEA